jgi:hypothetical protein
MYVLLLFAAGHYAVDSVGAERRIELSSTELLFMVVMVVVVVVVVTRMI